MLIPIDSSAAFARPFHAMIARNLETGAKFVLHEDRINRVEPVQEDEHGEGQWYPLTQDGLESLMLLPDGFVILQISESGSHIFCAPIVESSFLSMGFAVTNARRKRRRIPIKESADDIKALIRDNRPLLRHFLTLSDAYRSDQQLSSAEAKTAMEVLLKGIYDRNPEAALAWGNVTFEPNQLAWISFLDTIGQQTLGQFLGISRIEDIPGGDIEARVDQIRKDAGADKPQSEPEPAPPLISSKEQKRANLLERHRRSLRAINPRLANFYR